MIEKLDIRLYQARDESNWNRFVTTEDVPNLLFMRDFMTYHEDRFKDYSLVVYDADALIAICPAHKVETQLRSHWGLTYGGLHFTKDLNEIERTSIWAKIKVYLTQHGFSSIMVKQVPDFYLEDQTISKENLFYSNWQMVHSEPVFAIDYNKALNIHKTKLKHYRRNQNSNFEIERTNSFSEFWENVLIPRLTSRHGVTPVHSLSEISMLASRFPDNIIQYNLRSENEILAGITLFDKGKVIKSQYGATTDKGEKLRALEFLFIHLIYKYQQQEKSFFSMGTIGDKRFAAGFNPGLKKQKEELGCEEFHQHFFTFDLS